MEMGATKAKKESKIKKDKQEAAEEGEIEQEDCPNTDVVDTTPTYEQLVKLVCPIAAPLASKKLTKRLLKMVKKSGKIRKLKRGVREVVKALRKDVKGIVIFAGDISPIDVITHIPVYCEERCVPYCFVPSRRQLGGAGGTKRPTSVVLVQRNDDYEDLYQKCYSEVDALPIPL